VILIYSIIIIHQNKNNLSDLSPKNHDYRNHKMVSYILFQNFYLPHFNNKKF